MYRTDTRSAMVWRYPFDAAAGTLGAETEYFPFDVRETGGVVLTSVFFGITTDNANVARSTVFRVSSFHLEVARVGCFAFSRDHFNIS